VRVNEGGGISSGFQEGDLLPALVPQMIATGEETGRLAMVTGRVADFYEREWRKKLAIFSRVAELPMLVVMGVVVGLLVSSLILPIFKLSRIVH
jgi:type II secretory pathway component PulF